MTNDTQLIIKKISLFILILAVCTTAKIQVKIHTAVFSENQNLWSNKTTDKNLTLKNIGIMPLVTNRYKEKNPCDSCRFLSANGVQFILENYFLSKVSEMMPNNSVELFAPHTEILQGKKIKLMDIMDSLDFPFSKWFDGFEQKLIYRPKDRFTSKKTKKYLDKIGGLLGASHLLIPTDFKMEVDPKIPSQAKGNMKYEFKLVFWNVELSYPEWVLSYREKKTWADLNTPLNKALDKHLITWINNIPNKIKVLMEQEPK